MRTDRPSIDIDWGEVITIAARPVIAWCARNGLLVHFDCECQPSRIDIDLPVLQATLHRLFTGFTACVRPGGFMVILSSADEDPDEPGLLKLSLRLATSDGVPPDERPRQAAALDAFVAREHRPWGLPTLVSDHTRLHHGVEDGHHAVLLKAELQVPGRLDHTLVHARGAEAWIVQSPRHSSAALPRRVQRLGWKTRGFNDCSQALRALHSLPPGEPAPARMVVIESPGNRADDALALFAALPAGTQRFFGVLSGSATITQYEHRPELHLHVVPVSANELMQATAALSEGDDLSATIPGLLPQLGTPRVLVVDDDETNRIVAAALLTHAGYEASTAADGLQAIAMCEREAPQAVLMDIDMLPLDGFETTRHLLALQRLGRMPPFPILAATAGVYDDLTVEQAGMAGLITKPISLPVLQQALRRVLKGSLAQR